MTSPVRPPIFPPAAATRQAAPSIDAGRAAAQKAFFDIAMGKAAPPAATAAAPAAPSGPKPVQRTPDPNAEAQTRILRPGSLLDIRV